MRILKKLFAGRRHKKARAKMKKRGGSNVIYHSSNRYSSGVKRTKKQRALLMRNK